MKSRAVFAILVVLSTVAMGAVTSAPAQAAALPVQVLNVWTTSSTSTNAIVEAYQRPAAGGAYVRMHAPFYARVGSNGMGPTREGWRRTPTGVFGLTEAYGRLANPGTTLPYKVIDAYDWWVSDARSRYYNTHYRCGGTTPCPFDTTKGEQLIKYGSAYNYLVVINYNRSPVVKGAGSAFFLHVTTGGPTAGCVGVAQNDMVWLLRWLYKAHNPAIQIFVR